MCSKRLGTYVHCFKIPDQKNSRYEKYVFSKPFLSLKKLFRPLKLIYFVKVCKVLKRTKKVLKIVKINFVIFLPKASKTQPTVPSPPQTMIRTLATSRYICKACEGPPLAKLYTWRGLSRYWHFRRILEPCRPPDLGLTKTRSGLEFSSGEIWKLLGPWKIDKNCPFLKASFQLLLSYRKRPS